MSAARKEGKSPGQAGTPSTDMTSLAADSSPYAILSTSELEQVLLRVPGVEWVSTKPRQPKAKPNHFGVDYKMRPAGASKQIGRRVPCTEPPETEQARRRGGSPIIKSYV